MTEPNELDSLKERANIMGIAYHPNIGLEKLQEKINEKLTPTVAVKESVAARNVRLRKEANKKIRVRLTCMNPAKKDWPGEIISVSNSAIGVIKLFVPFDAEEGWHIPTVLFDVLKDRQYQSFYTVKIDGRKVKKSRLVKEFAIAELDPLTIPELTKLAAKQAREKTGE